MKKIILTFCMLMPLIAHAQLAPDLKKNCEILLEYAQSTTQIQDWVYDSCGFNDPDIAWYEWAPYVSQKQYDRALYVLCELYPDHEYGPLYCEKAAQLKFSPALYKLANKAKKAKDYDAYESYLQTIIADSTPQSQVNEYDKQYAYLDLAQFYYTHSKDQTKRENIIPYLQKAAEMHNPIAASSLAILLFNHQNQSVRGQYDKYLWQAIITGCPAAEEFLGITTALQNGSMKKNTADSITNRLLFTCDNTRQEIKKVWSQEQINQCGCPALLGRLKTQENKPFTIVSINDKTVTLKDKKDNIYTVSAGDKITDGYILESIHPTTVKIKRQAVSITLLLIDQTCTQICQDAQKQSTVKQQTYRPYQLTFTDDECQKLARYIETLKNPLKPFRGIKQCQLQDWKRWGELALEKRRNKHLFLLANYDKSAYIPSLIVRAQRMYAQEQTRAYPYIAKELKKAVQLNAVDELSAQRKHYAYCMLGSLYLRGPLQDDAEAVLWLKQAQDEYPYATNMLGVAYANGWGTERDIELAQQYFEKTLQIDAKQTPISYDALQNLNILKNNGDATQMHYGHCEDILNDTPLTVEQILQLYARKDQ